MRLHSVFVFKNLSNNNQIDAGIQNAHLLHSFHDQLTQFLHPFKHAPTQGVNHHVVPCIMGIYPANLPIDYASILLGPACTYQYEYSQHPHASSITQSTQDKIPNGFNQKTFLILCRQPAL